MAGDRSTALRMRLAAVGIHLDPPVADRDLKPSNLPTAEPDRAAIRAILDPRGCPEWAIVSCPSVELALTYREIEPPRRRPRAYPPVAR